VAVPPPGALLAGGGGTLPKQQTAPSGCLDIVALPAMFDGVAGLGELGDQKVQGLAGGSSCAGSWGTGEALLALSGVDRLQHVKAEMWRNSTMPSTTPAAEAAGDAEEQCNMYCLRSSLFLPASGTVGVVVDTTLKAVAGGQLP
jgi:hypothetical protein